MQQAIPNTQFNFDDMRWHACVSLCHCHWLIPSNPNKVKRFISGDLSINTFFVSFNRIIVAERTIVIRKSYTVGYGRSVIGQQDYSMTPYPINTKTSMEYFTSIIRPVIARFASACPLFYSLQAIQLVQVRRRHQCHPSTLWLKSSTRDSLEVGNQDQQD